MILKITNALSLTKGYILLLTSFALFGILSCPIAQAQKNKYKDAQVQEYKEDLSAYRIKYLIKDEDLNTTKITQDIKPLNDVTYELDSKLDSMHLYNLNVRTAQGYRILIYSGTKKDDALQAQLNAEELLANHKVYLKWDSPHFKVKVGDYFDKLEAYNMQTFLLKHFPGSIIVPDKININRYLR